MQMEKQWRKLYSPKYLKGDLMKRIIEFIKKLFIKTSSIFYVGATDILKEPLSKDEEEYYLKEFFLYLLYTLYH